MSSGIPAPTQAMAQAGFMPAQAPMPLTTGMPDPVTITKQKDSYNKMLDEQLKQGVSVLEAQVKHQRDYLSAQAGQQKKQFDMQIEMEVKQQEMALQQQYAEQTMALQQQAAQQKAALEQQAMQLSMEYQQKKAEEDMMKQQYEMEKQQQEMQIKMQREMEKLGVQAPQMQFGVPQMPGMSMQVPAGGIPQQEQGQTYVYGPNGELIPKEQWDFTWKEKAAGREPHENRVN